MCIFLLHRVVTFGDVPNIALRAVIPGVCVCMHFSPFLAAGPCGSGDKRPPISGDTDSQERARDTMVNAEEEEKGKERKRRKEKGPREKEGKKEKNNKRQHKNEEEANTKT